MFTFYVGFFFVGGYTAEMNVELNEKEREIEFCNRKVHPAARISQLTKYIRDLYDGTISNWESESSVARRVKESSESWRIAKWTLEHLLSFIFNGMKLHCNEFCFCSSLSLIEIEEIFPLFVVSSLCDDGWWWWWSKRVGKWKTKGGKNGIIKKEGISDGDLHAQKLFEWPRWNCSWWGFVDGYPWWCGAGYAMIARDQFGDARDTHDLLEWNEKFQVSS